jgi:hypothetical protein
MRRCSFCSKNSNLQNTRVCVVLLRDVLREKITISRYQNESADMVWGAISKKGNLPLVFIDGGVKIKGEYYKTEVVEKHLVPATRIVYGYCVIDLHHTTVMRRELKLYYI